MTTIANVTPKVHRDERPSQQRSRFTRPGLRKPKMVRINVKPNGEYHITPVKPEL